MVNISFCTNSKAWQHFCRENGHPCNPCPCMDEDYIDAHGGSPVPVAHSEGQGGVRGFIKGSG